MNIPDIHRSVCISRAGQQVKGEAVTILCDKGICEKGQGGEHWCLTSFLRHYEGGMWEGEAQCQKRKYHPRSCN